MHDFLLKLTFCTGLLLIVFHSTIFLFVQQDEQPTQKSSHLINQQTRQPKSFINNSLISKKNNTTKLPQTTLNKTPRHKTQKTKNLIPSVVSKRKSVQELSDQYIETILNKQKRFFKTCYMRHLKNNFASKGSVVLSFNIDSPGTVSGVSIQSGSIKDISLHECMKKVVERVKFTYFSGPPTKVFYPIEFH